MNNDKRKSKKRIFVGEIYDEFDETPIENFEKVFELSKDEEFEVYTNNAQVVEAFEVLCSRDVEVYLLLNDKCKKVSFLTAYNYLGDMYDTIDELRVSNILLSHMFTDEERDKIVLDEIKEYREKWSDFIE